MKNFLNLVSLAVPWTELGENHFLCLYLTFPDTFYLIILSKLQLFTANYIKSFPICSNTNNIELVADILQLLEVSPTINRK